MKLSLSEQIMKDSGCTASGGLIGLGYMQWYSSAMSRHLQGQRQRYCATCGLCRYDDEVQTCPKFVHSPEMDAYYAKEAKKV